LICKEIQATNKQEVIVSKHIFIGCQDLKYLEKAGLKPV
jgi:hypothetical protein